jgi:hypothetical protein
MSTDDTQDPVEVIRKQVETEMITGVKPLAEVKLEKREPKPEVALASKLYMKLPIMTEKYRALLKGTTKSGLFTNSMIYAYQKGMQDAIKLLLKGNDNEKTV